MKGFTENRKARNPSTASSRFAASCGPPPQQSWGGMRRARFLFLS